MKNAKLPHLLEHLSGIIFLSAETRKIANTDLYKFKIRQITKVKVNLYADL